VARRAEGLVTRLYRRDAAALGLPASLPDLDDLARLAAPHYAPALRGGLGHLEVATYLACARDASADLVVSVKPFGCLPSSALSDGVLPALARRRRPVFVALETTGDATAQLESRLELALDQARARQAQGPARPGESPSSQSSPPRPRRSDTT
jgi:predicted nucleotide-binding protein (sugar kinase/HSP70/actin superfamily)